MSTNITVARRRSMSGATGAVVTITESVDSPLVTSASRGRPDERPYLPSALAAGHAGALVSAAVGMADRARVLCARVGESPRLATVFRHPIDAVPTAVVLAVLAAQSAVFLCVHDPLRVLVAVALLFPVQVNFAGMCHNHHHLNTFRQRPLNRAFEVVMFLQLEMLPYGYTLHHNLGHHRHYMDQAADSNCWRRTDGRTMGPWEFAWVLFLDMYPTVIRLGRRHPAVYRKFKRMAWVCAGVLGALVAIHPVNALLVFVLPLPLALLVQA